MSLLDEFKEMLMKEDAATPSDVADYINDVQQVSDEYVDSGRWSEHWTAVFKRSTLRMGGTDLEWVQHEYVALDYERPATEMQEGGDFYSEAYAVKPVQVTITKYEKV